MAPALSVGANSLDFKPKEIKVRTPRRGRAKNIVVNKTKESKNFPIGRLNNYDKEMKKHKGPLSFCSQLESIEDDENESKELGSSKENVNIDPSCMASGDLSNVFNNSKGSNASFNDGYGNSSKNDDKV